MTCNIGRILLVLLCLELCSTSVYSASQMKTLEMVHVIMRHGDRNPEFFLSSDSANGPDSWPGGPGELTDLGIMQNFVFGQWLKNRYSGFIGDSYRQKEVYSRADGGKNRSLMAAEVAMAGVYSDYNFGPNNALGYPVPIHSFDVDPALSDFLSCPKASLLGLKIPFSSKTWQYLLENKNFFKYLKEHVGSSNMLALHDQIESEYHHLDQHTPPDWATPYVHDRINELAGKFLSVTNVSSSYLQLRGGPLYKEIANRMEQKSNEDWRTLSPDLKFILYGTHDLNIVEVLQNIGAFDDQWPPFASALIFELHQTGGDYTVEIYYQNSTDSPEPTDLLRVPFPIRIPECSALACPLNEFIEIASPHFPQNWQNDCNFGIKQSESQFTVERNQDKVNWKNLAFVFMGIAAVLTILITSLAVTFIIHRTKSPKPADSCEKLLQKTRKEKSYESFT